MKKCLIALLLFSTFSTYSYADDVLGQCKDIEHVSQSIFSMFSTKKYIQVGRCVAEKWVNQGRVKMLGTACAQVIEHNNNPLGFMALSPAEAIQMGMCAQVIKLINQNYGTRQYDHYNRYRCLESKVAVDILKKVEKEVLRVTEIRDLLCQR